VFDVDAYLQRIGLRGRPSVADVHRAHALAIPFENLDPRRGVPVSIDTDDLQRKLVAGRRGGFCFEHNLLLADALAALGYGVELLLARVRANRPLPSGIRPRTHCALRITDGDGTVWHGDVGFGSGTPLRPLPFGAGREHEIDGWGFQIVTEDALLVMQARDHLGAWGDMYSFEPEPVPRIDCELSSWYASTWPRHPMVSGLIVSANGPDGARVSLSDWSGELVLSEHEPGAPPAVDAVDEADAPAILAQRFGLDGALLL
jgi:N-hydroxyarylamine O-acetyltransferase